MDEIEIKRENHVLHLENLLKGIYIERIVNTNPGEMCDAEWKVFDYFFDKMSMKDFSAWNKKIATENTTEDNCTKAQNPA